MCPHTLARGWCGRGGHPSRADRLVWLPPLLLVVVLFFVFPLLLSVLPPPRRIFPTSLQTWGSAFWGSPGGASVFPVQPFAALGHHSPTPAGLVRRNWAELSTWAERCERTDTHGRGHTHGHTRSRTHTHGRGHTHTGAWVAHGHTRPRSRTHIACGRF